MYIDLNKVTDKRFIDQIINSLTITEEDYNTDALVHLQYYIKTDDKIYLPRYYPYSNYEFIQQRKRTAGKKIDIAYKKDFSFRGDNKQYVRKSLNYDVCIIKRPPGKGKTIIGSGIITERKTKTLILVNMINLMTQWKEAILMVSDLNESDISINKLFNEKYKDCKIHISTIQNLSAKIKNKGFENTRKYIESLDIGLVIFDEVHLLVGAEKFSNTLFLLNSKYWVALSATPYKENQRDMILDYWFSKNLLGESDYDIIPKIKILKFKSLVRKDMNIKLVDPYENRLIKHSYWYIHYGKKFFRDRYFKKLFNLRNFLNLLYDIIYKNCILGRQILLLTHFNKDGVIKLYDYLLKKSNYFTNENVTTFIESDTNLKKLKQYKVILSNYKKFSTGINVPTIDTIILATPLTKEYELEQSIGRALRLNKHKQNVIVYDLLDIDFIERTQRWFNIRLSFYEKMNFIII